LKVLLPNTIAEVCAMLAAEEGVRPMAGATDLLVHWPGRLSEHGKTYADLSALGSALRPMSWSADGLRLGALTTYWDVLRDARVCAEYPLLAEAARQVGAIQIQSRGTWAGNIGNGSPAADGVPVLMACDASVVLTSRGGEREVALQDYFTGYRQSVRRQDELITAIVLPRPEPGFAAFHKVGPRRAQAITKVGVAIRQAGDGWRVVANSVAPTVKRCPAVERLLDSGSPVRSPDDLAPAVRSDVSPIDDIRSTAEYRRSVLCRLLYHSLRGVCPSVT
jgi:CO/xanthine dehydrogenase FAD-binding subunit